MMLSLEQTGVELLPREMTDEQLNEVSWQHGIAARYVLTPEQRVLWDMDEELPRSVKRIVAHWARRFGKSTSAQAIGDKRCRRNQYTNVIHGFPTKETATKVTRDNHIRIFKDCPLQWRPRWVKDGSYYNYPWNGSRYYVRGLQTESDIEQALGLGADLVIFDESGFIRYLKYAIQSFAPMLLGRPNGRMLIISSSATDPYHQFFVECDKAHEKDAAFSTKKIWETSLYQREELLEFAEDCGGTDSIEWRANYECERIIDEEFAVFPEWPRHRDEIIQEVERPRYFNTAIGLDLGFHPHFSFCVFGYYHFETGIIVVEDEFEVSRMTTDLLAAEVHCGEYALWSEYWDELDKHHPPFIVDRHGRVVTQRGPTYHARWQDVDPQIQADLTNLHDLPINQASNRHPHAQVNRVRIAMKSGRLKIHPRCERLIANCSAAQWNKQRTSFAEIPGFGHFDGASALCIFTSHIDQHSNPYPDVLPEQKSQDIIDLRRKPKAPKIARGFRRR